MTGFRARLRTVLRDVFGLVPTLDLHGLRPREAIEATERFVTEAHAAGETVIRIVYGKGRGSPGGVGVLRQAIPGWLEQHKTDLVERFERELDRDGNDGAMRVWLRQKRDDASKPDEADGADGKDGKATKRT
ncbi:MAG TPA: Smr/MutS family protein [Candidatus Binatia bacterium]